MITHASPRRLPLVRMFGSHQGNIGGVVPEGRIVIDTDPQSGGLESVIAITERHGPFSETSTARTGGEDYISTFFSLPASLYRISCRS